MSLITSFHLLFAFATKGSQRLSCNAQPVSCWSWPQGWAMLAGSHKAAGVSQPGPLLYSLTCLGCRKGLRDSLLPCSFPEPLAFVSLFPCLFLILFFFFLIAGYLELSKMNIVNLFIFPLLLTFGFLRLGCIFVTFQPTFTLIHF